MRCSSDAPTSTGSASVARPACVTCCAVCWQSSTCRWHWQGARRSQMSGQSCWHIYRNGVVESSAARLASLRFLRLHQGTKVHSAIGQPILSRLVDIWDRRDVLRMLAERGLRHKYGSSFLGYAWSLLE